MFALAQEHDFQTKLSDDSSMYEEINVEFLRSFLEFRRIPPNHVKRNMTNKDNLVGNVFAYVLPDNFVSMFPENIQAIYRAATPDPSFSLMVAKLCMALNVTATKDLSVLGYVSL